MSYHLLSTWSAGLRWVYHGRGRGGRAYAGPTHVLLSIKIRTCFLDITNLLLYHRSMPETLNQIDVQGFINDHFGDRASQLTRLSGGDWSQAYALTVDGQQVVVRFGAHGEDYQKDQIAA